MSTYNWRLHWEPKTRGDEDGNNKRDVIAVAPYDGSHSEFLGIVQNQYGADSVSWRRDGTCYEFSHADLIPRTPAITPADEPLLIRLLVALDALEESGWPADEIAEFREWIEARSHAEQMSCDYCHQPATRGRHNGWRCEPCGAVYGRRGWRFLGEYDS